MSNNRAITLTKGYVFNKDLMSDEEWDKLESGLNSREIEATELASHLGMSKEELESNLTHTDAIILDC